MGPGTVIAKKYRLVRSLGEGAMGTVWEAVNLFTHRPFALKLVRADAAAGSELMERMLREASAAGRLQHPNVIEVYDFGTTESGEPFLVMELLTGQTLESLLEQRSRLDVVRAAAVGVEVARALSVAHAAGIIHRDLKPANIFVHEEMERVRVIKVLDFGVSKHVGADPGTATITGVPIGTPAYMSPEQAQAMKSLDFTADIWALGVILFELVTGRLPYQGATAYAIVGELLHARIPRISEVLPEIDPQFDAIVARCLERDLTRRFASAREVEVQLESLLPKSSGAVLMDLDEDATLSRSAPAALAAATLPVDAAAQTVLGGPASSPEASGPHVPVMSAADITGPQRAQLVSYPELAGPGSGPVQGAVTQLPVFVGPRDAALGQNRVTLLFAVVGGFVVLLAMVLAILFVFRPSNDPDVLATEAPDPVTAPMSASPAPTLPPQPAVTASVAASAPPAPSAAPSATAPQRKFPVVRPLRCKAPLLNPKTHKLYCP